MNLKLNNSMSSQHIKKQPWDIIDEILGFTWLYRKVFGDLLPWLIYNQWLASSIEILEQIYWFEGVNQMFSPIIERKELKGLSKIMFRFNESPQTWFFGASNTEGQTNK
jgi:hypothetical protein